MNFEKIKTEQKPYTKVHSVCVEYELNSRRRKTNLLQEEIGTVFTFGDGGEAHWERT